ncbi:STAS domain-containing protein [Candidatus Riflebacteria bacterium]
MNDSICKIVTLSEEDPAPDTKIIRIAGDLDYDNASCAFDRIKEPLAKRPFRVIIDLEGVPYMDSHGLSFIFKTQKIINNYGGCLKLIKMSNFVFGVYNMAQFKQLIPIYKTVAEAMADHTT